MDHNQNNLYKLALLRTFMNFLHYRRNLFISVVRNSYQGAYIMQSHKKDMKYIYIKGTIVGTNHYTYLLGSK